MERTDNNGWQRPENTKCIERYVESVGITMTLPPNQTFFPTRTPCIKQTAMQRAFFHMK